MANVPGTPGDDLLYGTEDDDTITGIGGNDRLFGFGGNDSLDGGDGSDILDGGTGADTMTGGIGDDFYVVDNAGDIVTEASGAGSDLVFTTINYTLPADVERLAVYSRASTFAVNLTGNALDNEITGNDGANIIDGGAGRDSMRGALGDDQYIVSLQGNVTIQYRPSNSTLPGLGYFYLNSDQADFVVEHAAQGTDTIWVPFTGSTDPHSYFDYTLIRGNTFSERTNVERLGVLDPLSTYAVNLQGEWENETIMGNDGRNVLDGWTGGDTLIGYGGDDIYFVDDAGDVVTEDANDGYDTVLITRGSGFVVNANLTSYTLTDNVERVSATTNIVFNLTGNALNNEISGSDQANVIDGKLGADILQGRGGLDTFAFTTALGGGNVDQILDFSAGAEKIQLDDAIFTGLATGALAAGAFRTGAAAQDADDRIIYDNLTGALYFDADGNGAGAQVQFANLHEGLAMTAGDFTVI